MSGAVACRAVVRRGDRRRETSLTISADDMIQISDLLHLEVRQNFLSGFARSRMRSDRPTDADIVCARLDCLVRRHESFLIARLRPARTNSLDRDFDSLSKFRTQGFD